MALKRTLCLLAACLLAASAACAASKAPEFARVDVEADGEPRALQMSITRYVPAEGNRLLEIDLVGAVHIGDPAYYADLNRRFEDYDVLL